MRYKILTTATVISLLTATVSLPVFATEVSSDNDAASVSVQTETTDKVQPADKPETEKKIEKKTKQKVKEQPKTDAIPTKKKEPIKSSSAVPKPVNENSLSVPDKKPKDKTTAEKNNGKNIKPVTESVPIAPIINEPIEVITTRLDVSALVPEEFDKTILLNLLGNESQNIVVRLDKINDYIYSEEIDPGQYEVSFVNIVGENAADYNLFFDKKVVIKKGTANKFNLQVSEKMLQSGETDPPKEQEGISQERLEKMLNNDTNPSDHKENDLVKEVASEPFKIDTHEEKEVSKRVELSSGVINMIVYMAILLGSILLFYLYKKISYKHDYYDC